MTREVRHLANGNVLGETRIDRQLLQPVFIQLWARLEATGMEVSANDWYFENEIMSIRPYQLGTCTCGVEADSTKPHSVDCNECLPNFRYKPTGYELWWYQYPLRYAYANRLLTDDEFTKMITHCMESI